MAAKTRIGTMHCLCCALEIPVNQSVGGALSLGCPWCDLSAYAKEGTEAFALISPKIKRAAPAPGPVFSLGKDLTPDKSSSHPLASDPAPAPKKTKVWL